MISLIAAFKLCRIKDEMVYLKTEGISNDYGFWSEKIRKRLDMKHIQVVGIEPRFERFGYGYIGMMFTIRGMTDKELMDEEFYEMQM